MNFFTGGFSWMQLFISWLTTVGEIFKDQFTSGYFCKVETWLFQLTVTCSKSTIETLKKGAKYFEVKNKNTRTTKIMFWSFYC